MRKALLFLLFSLIFNNILLSTNVYLDSVNSLINNKKGDDKALLDIYRKTTSYLLDNRRDEEALSYLIVYEGIANKTNDVFNKSYVDYLYGKYYFEKTKLTETILKLNSAYNLIKSMNDPETIKLKIKLHLAYSACYLDCGMLPEACEHLQKGLEINKKFDGELRNEVTINHNLAILYTYLDNNDRALTINKQNLENPYITKDIIFSTYYNMSINYLELLKSDSAMYCIDKASENVSIEKEEMMCYLRKGTIFLFNENYREAEDYYHKALNIIGDNKDYYIIYYEIIITNMAKLCYNLKRYDEALHYIEITDNISNVENNMECLNLKINIFTDKKQYKDALQLMMRKETLQDSISKQKNIDKTNQLLMQYQIKELENEYANQQEIIRLKHSRVKIILVSFIGLLIGIVIVVILLLNRKKILLHNKQLSEEAMANELETRNREIASNVVTVMKKNEIYAEMVKKLIKVKENAVKDETKSAITGIIKDIEKTIDSDINEEFVTRFKQVHSEFYDNLLEKFPDLTANEIRLCAYLKLNMNTKDIIALTGQSERSIIIARYRLRRKLGMKSGDSSNLSTFISNI